MENKHNYQMHEKPKNIKNVLLGNLDLRFKQQIFNALKGLWEALQGLAYHWKFTKTAILK